MRAPSLICYRNGTRIRISSTGACQKLTRLDKLESLQGSVSTLTLRIFLKLEHMIADHATISELGGKTEAAESELGLPAVFSLRLKTAKRTQRLGL